MSSSNVQAQGVVAAASTPRVRNWGVAVLGLVVLYGALAFGIHNGLTRTTQGANDFYSRWMGARALFVEGKNPFSDEVTREIQLGMYGRLAHPDEDQVAFAYPLFAAYAAAPLVLLPYPMAQALWMALLIVGVVAGTLALAMVNRWTVSPLTLALLVLGVLIFYPFIRGVFLGQYALLSFACVALAMLAIARGHDASAGILLALATVKPQPVVLLLPAILFWAWWNRRRSVVWSALVTLALLIGTALLFVPNWLGDFLVGLRNYSRYAPAGPPLETLFKLLLPVQTAFVGFLVVSVGLVAWAAVMVWRRRTLSWFEFQPTLGFVALVTTLMAWRIGTPDQIFLLLPWMAWFGLWSAQRKPFATIVCAAVLIAAPWIVFLMLLEGYTEAVVVPTILPLFTLCVFLLMTFIVGRGRGLAR